LPAIAAGLLFKREIEESLRTPIVVAATLALGSIVFFVAERRGAKTRSDRSLTMTEAVWIGCAQALALVPGVSRSGITLVAAMAIGLRRDAAARFSFLLGVPAIAGAGIFELKPLLKSRDVSGSVLAVGLIAAAVAGYASIAWLLRFLRARSTRPFVVYRIALGAMLLALLFTHHLAP
jgi:undecaprenyl-diphosphatase